MAKNLGIDYLKKYHPEAGPGPNDADVLAKMETASAIVLTHLKRPAEWDVNSDASNDTEFAVVQGAVLTVLTRLYYKRGDEEKPLDPLEGLYPILSLLRDPAMA